MNGEFPAVNLPVRFISAGQVVSEPGWIHPKRRLNTHLLITVKQGRFGLAAEGRKYVLSAGQAFLLPSGLELCGFHAEREESPVYYWACFEDDSLSGRDPGSQDALSADLPDQFVCFHFVVQYDRPDSFIQGQGDFGRGFVVSVEIDICGVKACRQGCIHLTL